MPTPEHVRARTLLRKDLLAQLRHAERPLTAAEMCALAPRVPVPGAATPFPPIIEQVSRALETLRRAGLAQRHSHPDHPRRILWVASPDAQRAADLVLLEALWRTPSPQGAT